MAEVVDAIRIVIEQIIQGLGYPGIVLVMFAENIFPPIPSELVMPFAGFLVADKGALTLPGVIIAGTAGSVLGAMALYGIGMWADEPVIRRFVRRFGRYLLLDEADLDRVLGVFDRHGELIVFVGRLMPLVRSLISLPAGMQRMNFKRFLLFTTLGSAIWTTILSVAGYLLGENWEQILTVIDKYELVMTVAMIAGVGYLVIKHGRERLRRLGFGAHAETRRDNI